MFRKRNDKNHHPKLLETIHAANFPNDSDGACFGYAVMAVQAVLMRDTAAFDRRMTLIYEEAPAAIAKEMNDAMTPASQYGNPTKQQFYIDMHAYLGSVSLYQNMRPYSYLFDVPLLSLKQSIDRAKPLLTQQQLLDTGAIVEADSFYSVYNYPELILMLTSLQKFLRESNIDYPIAFLFKSSNHALTLGFDPKYDKWLYMEVHEGVTKFPEHIHIADMINQVFSRNSSTSVTIKAYTTGNHSQQTKELLAQWKKNDNYNKTHSMSVWRIAAEDTCHAGLLYLVVINDDVKRLATLLKSSHVDPNKKTSADLAAIHLTAIYDLSECAKLLLQHLDTDVNLTTGEDKVSALHIAIAQNNHKVVHELLRHPQVDVNLERADSLSPIHMAALGARTLSLRELLKMPSLDINKATKTGMTALHFAVQENHVEAVKEILEHPNLNIDAVNDRGATALMTAAAFNHLEIAKLILQKYPHTVHLTIQDLSALTVAYFNKHQAMMQLLLLYLGSRPTLRPN